MKHYTIHFQPDDVTTVIHQGATLLEAAALAGIILTTPCGGAGRCGKCKVKLMPSNKDVLACTFVVDRDLEVWIYDTSRFYRQKILEHGIEHRARIDPSVRKIPLNGPFGGPDDFFAKLASKVDEQVVIADECSRVLDHTAWHSEELTAVVVSGQPGALPPETPCFCLTAVEQAQGASDWYGLAVDIGTTTIVARLINMVSGQLAATASCGNPQAKFGADVISRISHGSTDTGLQDLHECITACLNDLAGRAAHSAGIQVSDIYEIAAAGNTTMSHLLLKLPVIQLGQAPYRAYSLLEASRRPSEIGIQINDAGRVYVLPNIAGFVGSDTVAAALACELDTSCKGTLLVDIGTNGELVLSAKGRMIAASCAAGPALEGAGIEFGSRAQAGAIERVILTGDQIDVDVIEGVPAASLCGSGLIDAMAVLLETGVIDYSGRFVDGEELPPLMPEAIRRRLIQHNNAPAFVLSGTFRGAGWENAVFLTQKDVRQFQLAKAAIHAGIQILLSELELKSSDIQKLLLAGAFGNYIRRESAVRTGLLPGIPIQQIHFVGNAAGTGAEMVLISRQARARAVQLAKEIEYLEIAGKPEFQGIFAENLLFPE
jgi:uncharacterized 2Fe-2S/4Fe-4S cluster protein (DUF4445 family)